DPNGELMRFVAFWHTVTGTDPQWLSFDSKRIDSAEMSRVHPRKIPFVTIRRRGAAILRRLAQRPASDGRKAVIDTPKRCHHQIRSLDEMVPRRGDEGPIRQLAVTGLERDPPTLF